MNTKHYTESDLAEARKITRYIGSRMLDTLDYMHRNDGTVRSKRALSAMVGPYGSNNYGWQIVMRCVRRGLISEHPVPGANRHELKLTPLGYAALSLTEPHLNI